MSSLTNIRMLPPKLKKKRIQRVPLTAKIQQGFTKKVTVLEAGAGHGKTMVLRQALEQLQCIVFIIKPSFFDPLTPDTPGNCQPAQQYATLSTIIPGGSRMIQITELYLETLDILRGKRQLPPIFSELKDWLYKEYHVTAYNFTFEKMPVSHPTYQNRLYILLSSGSDYRAMFDGLNYGQDKQVAITAKLAELAGKVSDPAAPQYAEAFVAYCNFFEELASVSIRNAYNLIEKKLTRKYSRHSVWKIMPFFSSVAVFFMSEADLQTNQQNSIARQIKADFYRALHQLDEFKVFSYESLNITYDSKENLDQNYQGNLYYYFK